MITVKLENEETIELYDKGDRWYLLLGKFFSEVLEEKKLTKEDKKEKIVISFFVDSYSHLGDIDLFRMKVHLYRNYKDNEKQYNFIKEKLDILSELYKGSQQKSLQIIFY